MLPAPFYAEVPHDLGDDAAWWGNNLMQALSRLCRHQPTDACPELDHDHRAHPSHAAAPLHA